MTYINHPEFPDILVDTSVYTSIHSKDAARTFTFNGNEWVSDNNQVYASSLSREQFILHYCFYDEKTGTTFYRPN